MKYSLFGKFTAQPGKQDELLGMLLHAAKLLEQNKDCIHYIVSTADDQDGIWIYETWTDKAAHDASLEPEEVRAQIAKVIPLVASMSKLAELQVRGGKGL